MTDTPIFPADPVVDAVAKRLLERAAVGMKTYGISMDAERKPVTYWIDHAIEELLDAANYLQKLRNDLVALNAASVRQWVDDIGYEYDAQRWVEQAGYAYYTEDDRLANRLRAAEGR